LRVWLFFHLIGGAIWLGGMITMGALVPAMRRVSLERSQIQAVARQFGRVSWVGFGLAVGSGLGLWSGNRIALNDSRLFITKISLVALVGALAYAHQGMRERTPRSRGLVQGLILLVSLGIFAAGAAL